MKKNFEYREPEFKVVIANCEDILTASGGVDPGPGPGPSPSSQLSTVSASWEMGTFTL